MSASEPTIFDGELAGVAHEVITRDWPCRRDERGNIVFLATCDDGRKEKVVVWSHPMSGAPSSVELGNGRRDATSIVTVSIGLVQHLELSPDLLSSVKGFVFRLATGQIELTPHKPVDPNFPAGEAAVRASLEFQFLGAALDPKAVVGVALDMAESARGVRAMINERHGGSRDGIGVGPPFSIPLSLDPELLDRDGVECPVEPPPELAPSAPTPPPAPEPNAPDLPKGLLTFGKWAEEDAFRRGFDEANPLVLAQVLAKRNSLALRHRLGNEAVDRLIAIGPDRALSDSLGEDGPTKVLELLKQVDINVDQWSLYLNKVAEALLSAYPEIPRLLGVDPENPPRRGGRPRMMAADRAPVVPPEVDDSVGGMPVKPLVRPVPSKADLIANLKHRVKGQDHVIEPVASRIVMTRKGLGGRSKVKPDGVFLFAGPTGVGKTELAKGIANEIYGESTSNMIRIDMSELYDKWAISRLTGSNPGYIGFDQPDGWLTTKIINNPHCVLLLDEFEKASPEVWMAFLQIFDEGRLTDGRGQTADFSQTIIVLTSNVGSAAFTKRDMGFGQKKKVDMDDLNATRGREVMTAVRKAMPPELFNRLDATLIFDALSEEMLSEIATAKLKKVATELVEVDYIVEFSPEVAELVATADWDPALGARPMMRTIDRLVREPLSEIEAGVYAARVDNDLVVYEPREPEEASVEIAQTTPTDGSAPEPDDAPDSSTEPEDEPAGEASGDALDEAA